MDPDEAAPDKPPAASSGYILFANSTHFGYFNG